MERFLQYWWVAVIAVVVVLMAVIVWRRRQIRGAAVAFGASMARASRVVLARLRAFVISIARESRAVWIWSRARRFWTGFIAVHILVIAISILYELRIIK